MHLKVHVRFGGGELLAAKENHVSMGAYLLVSD